MPEDPTPVTPRSRAAWSGGDALHHQTARFLLVGATTVAIDFVVYQLLLAAALPLDAAKATSFVLATVCAYLLNRSFTFRAADGPHVVGRFALLYTAALIVNVGVNALVLRLLHGGDPEEAGVVVVTVAFLVAQAVSSTMNFLGMRHVVFARRP